MKDKGGIIMNKLNEWLNKPYTRKDIVIQTLGSLALTGLFYGGLWIKYELDKRKSNQEPVVYFGENSKLAEEDED